MGPPAPWSLSGEVLVARLPRPPGTAAAPPAGVRPVPGPAVLWAGHWAQTPIGPFSELGVAVPARLGGRLGLCAVLSVVTSADARVAGRLSWGLPRQLGALRWLAHGTRRTLRWDEGDVEVRGQARPGLALPVWVPLRGLQRRGDGPVVVPSRLGGYVRRAALSVSSPTDELCWLAGDRSGLLVSGRQLVLEPSRQPRGRFRTLLAPASGVDPQPA